MVFVTRDLFKGAAQPPMLLNWLLYFKRKQRDWFLNLCPAHHSSGRKGLRVWTWALVGE